MVYCVINPIICPTLLVYYILSMLTEKYLCMYTYKPVYESGGSNWSAVSALNLGAHESGSRIEGSHDHIVFTIVS